MLPYIDVSPHRTVAGSLRMPGDKSISHRAVLLSIIADSPITVVGCSPAEDVRSSLTAVRTFGVRVVHEGLPEGEGRGVRGGDSQNLELAPPKPDTMPLERRVDVGNSGTSLRIGLGICVSVEGTTYLDGDMSIRRRPMLRVVEPLRAMGADIIGEQGGDRAPLVVRGAELSGAVHELSVASAQVASALLLAGLRAEGRTEIRLPGPARDHTQRMLRSLGLPIDLSTHRLVVERTPIHGGSIDVPGDISSAAPFLAAAAVTEASDLQIPWVGVNPLRTGFLDILRAFGAEVTVDEVVEVSGEPRGTVRLRPGDRRPLDVRGDLVVRAIDELPLVAVLGAAAEGTTSVSDAGELRVKESDRIGRTVEGLQAMGVDIQGTPDGFVVHGRGTIGGGAQVDPAGDHRLAMAFAVAGLAAREAVRIADPGCVDVSHPGFFDDLLGVAVP